MLFLQFLSIRAQDFVSKFSLYHTPDLSALAKLEHKRPPHSREFVALNRTQEILWWALYGSWQAPDPNLFMYF